MVWFVPIFSVTVLAFGTAAEAPEPTTETCENCDPKSGASMIQNTLHVANAWGHPDGDSAKKHNAGWGRMNGDLVQMQNNRAADANARRDGPLMPVNEMARGGNGGRAQPVLGDQRVRPVPEQPRAQPVPEQRRAQPVPEQGRVQPVHEQGRVQSVPEQGRVQPALEERSAQMPEKPAAPPPPAEDKAQIAARLDAATNEMGTASKQYEKTLGFLAECERQEAMFLGNIAELHRTLSGLQEDISVCGGGREKAEAEIARKRALHDKTKALLERTQAKVAELRDAIAKLKAEAETARARAQTAGDELERIKADDAATDRSLQNANRAKSEAEAKLEAAKHRLDGAKAMWARAQETSEERVKQMNARLKQAMQDVDAMETLKQKWNRRAQLLVGKVEDAKSVAQEWKAKNGEFPMPHAASTVGAAPASLATATSDEQELASMAAEFDDPKKAQSQLDSFPSFPGMDEKAPAESDASDKKSHDEAAVPPSHPPPAALVGSGYQRFNEGV